MFVILGAFYIEMTFFSAIGKYIINSGGTHLLKQSRILEKGDSMGLLQEKVTIAAE